MKRKVIYQAVVILLIALVPALYACIFLFAYWDPTSHLSDIAVAVVNNDKGALVDGASMNIGTMLTDQLKSRSDVKWVFTSLEDAERGLNKGDYYAELVIPDDFTQCISTASQAGRTQGTLRFKYNDKLGTFASSLLSGMSANLENVVSSSITESLVNTLTDKLKELPGSLGQLGGGLGKLHGGVEQLAQGMSALSQGEEEFDSHLGELAEGLKKTDTGSQTIKDSLRLLYGKSQLFSTKLNKNLSSIQTLSAFSGQYNSGFKTLSSNLDGYLGASSKIIQQSMSIATLLQSYIKAHPESMTDINMRQIAALLSAMSGTASGGTDPVKAAADLSAALNQLTQAYAQINAAVQQLPKAMQTAAASAAALSKAIGQISDGSSTLSSGIDTLSQGADMLYEKARLILSSSKQILSGIDTLQNGIDQIKTSVDNSVLQMQSDSSALEGFGNYAANPVKMETVKIGDVKNTGMSIAPFTVSLCLWLGGLMYIIVFTTMEKLKFAELKFWRIRIDFGLYRFQVIAVLQSVCLAFAVQEIVGLPLGNAAQFYGICILGGVTFITIIQVTVMIFQDFGKLLSIIFMLLQLMAGGGMLSMALVPAFYRAIHPYMPMTYTTEALRNNIMGMDAAVYNHSMWILAVCLVTGLLLAALLSFLTNLIRGSKKKAIQTAVNP